MRIFILISLDCVSICCGVQCMIGDGKPVDWFIIYKLPILPDRNEPYKRGAGYFYMHDKDPNWRRSTYGLDTNKENPLIWTLKPLYTSNSPNFEYKMYNDQPPSSYSHSNYAHSKGVVAFDENDGFWLIHSLPHYPISTDYDYEWPDNAKTNGQTFLCVTYNRNMLQHIYTQLNFMKVFVYDEKRPDDQMQPNRFIDLTSKNGQVFRHFAKEKEFGKDLYKCFVAENIKHSLKTVTWRVSSTHQMLEGCTNGYNVFDQQCVTFSDGTNQVTYLTTKEHSKWAISTTGRFTCIGDINRETSQNKRGGGTACIENQQIWNQFYQLVPTPINPVQTQNNG